MSSSTSNGSDVGRVPRGLGVAGLGALLAALGGCPSNIDDNVEGFEKPGQVGAECRPADHPDGPCDQNVGGADFVDAKCVGGTCLVDCTEGGDFLCGSVVLETLACSATAGYACVPACVDGACGEGFACLTSENVCLPTGTFPGSPCREGDDPCDANVGGVEAADMQCVEGTCAIGCADGGSALCQEVNAALTCSAAAGDACVFDCSAGQACPGGFDCFETEGTCLPTGAFPGSPCRVQEPACDSDLSGNPDADMVCVSGSCAVDCSAGGDALCEGVDASLKCVAAAGSVCLPKCDPAAEGGGCGEGFACFASEGACLPLGSFPGSPCRPDDGLGPVCDTNVGGVDGADMQCVEGLCVVPCADDAGVCGMVDVSLKCVQAAGQICLPRCGEFGECDAGYSCFPTENACLPRGTFPGSPCRQTEGDRCDKDLGGDPNVDMVCVSGTCIIDCNDGGNALCQGVDPSLECSLAAGNVCVPSCVDGACDATFACLESEGVCLPLGSFPGAPCRDDEPKCDIDIGGDDDVDLSCVGDVCVATCAVGGTATCQKLNENLVCAETAGDICLLKCAGDGTCSQDGFECFTQDDICLPQGAFPGSTCRPEPGNECDQNVGGQDAVDMVCQNDTCLVDCSAGGDGLCSLVSPSLKCSAAAGGVCVLGCDAGSCDPGFSCFESEGTCLPTGAFPGSPCADGACAPVAGNAQVCTDPGIGAEICVVDCSTGGTALCQGIDASLSCYDSGTGPALCLPNGTFPESLCRDQDWNRCDQDLQGVSDVDMGCYGGTCQVDCTNAGSALCGLFAKGLDVPASAFACVETGIGSFCARAGCAGGGVNCPADYHCDPSVGPAGACLPYKPVHVIHMNDLHSHFDGLSPFSNPSAGGYARLASIVKGAQAYADSRDAVRLTLDGGDFMMGTLFHILQGNVEMDFFKVIEVDATTVGNHELDWGPDGLATFLGANVGSSPIMAGACGAVGGCPTLKPTPVLAANMVFDPVAAGDDALEAFYDPDASEPVATHPLKRFVVLEKQGLKVGVFGLMGANAAEITFTKDPLTFDPLVETAQEMVDTLRAPPHDADIVIAVSHSGSSPPPFKNEDEVVAEQVEGLDVIVSGHTHELVLPKMINGTRVAQAWSYSRVLGEMELGFVTRPYGKGAGKLDPELLKYTVHDVDPAGTQDPVVMAARGQYITEIDTALSAAGLAYAAPLGAITTDFVHVVGEESNLGNLIADANRLVVSAAVAVTSDPTPIDVAIEAGGVIRDDIRVDPDNVPTPVWLADVFAAEPLGASPTDQTAVGYPMTTIYLTGDEVKAMLEVAATLFFLRGDDFWLSVSGVKFTYDVSLPAFERVTGIWLDPDGSADVCDGASNLLNASGQAKDGAALYRVAANIYVAGFAALLGELTQGALNVVPKDESGTPADPLARIVPDGSGGQLRQWAVLAQHVGALATANGGLIVEPSMGRVVEAADLSCP